MTTLTAAAAPVRRPWFPRLRTGSYLGAATRLHGLDAARWLFAPLIVTGSMALTAYVAHVIALGLLPGGGESNAYLAWLLAGLIAGCCLWRLIFAHGPLEQAMGAAADRMAHPPARELLVSADGAATLAESLPAAAWPRCPAADRDSTRLGGPDLPRSPGPGPSPDERAEHAGPAPTRHPR